MMNAIIDMRSIIQLEFCWIQEGDIRKMAAQPAQNVNAMLACNLFELHKSSLFFLDEFHF